MKLLLFFAFFCATFTGYTQRPMRHADSILVIKELQQLPDWVMLTNQLDTVTHMMDSILIEMRKRNDTLDILNKKANALTFTYSRNTLTNVDSVTKELSLILKTASAMSVRTTECTLLYLKLTLIEAYLIALKETLEEPILEKYGFGTRKIEQWNG